jgi:hypothetical protein
MAFMQGAVMDPATAHSLGLSVWEPPAAPALSPAPQGAELQAANPAATAAAAAAEAGSSCPVVTEDHIFIGTAKGEVLVCDVSRQGLLVLRVPVLK